jgi:hypothetical protein
LLQLLIRLDIIIILQYDFLFIHINVSKWGPKEYFFLFITLKVIIYNLLDSFLILNSFLFCIFIKGCIVKHIISKTNSKISKRYGCNGYSIYIFLSIYTIYISSSKHLHWHHYWFILRVLKFSWDINYLSDKFITQNTKSDTCPLFIRQVIFTTRLCHKWLLTNEIFSQKRKRVATHNILSHTVNMLLSLILIF